MAQRITTDCPSVVQHSTAQASLAALGVHLQHLDLFGPIRVQVHIAQKTVRYTPANRSYDAFIALLAGAHGSMDVFAHMRRYKPPLGGRDVPNNRWCSAHWMPAPRRR